MDTSAFSITNGSDASNIRFELEGDIVAEYANTPLPFGFDGLGEFVYQRTYSRTKPDGFTETWPETCLRVTNGAYTMQKQHIFRYKLGWNEEQGQRSAREFFDRLFNLKFTPPGRGLWAMGTNIIYERGLYAALNNCAFTTTAGIDTAPSIPFMFLMDMSMLGVGVGFDVAGADKTIVFGPEESFSTENLSYERISQLAEIIDTVKVVSNYAKYLEQQINIAAAKLADEAVPQYVKNGAKSDKAMYETELAYIGSLDQYCIQPFVIPDTREGWVQSVGMIIDSYLKEDQSPIVFDYTEIRPEGVPINGFGGKASGPEPLLDLHIMIRKIFGELKGKPITKTAIVDIMNLIGKAVVAGNVRRSSEIALGDPDDEEFMDLKNYEKNPQRMGWSWASNNSVYGKVGMDYTNIAQRIADNGEPGVFWLDNVRAYSRMDGAPDYKDHRVLGTNPCGEQSLESTLDAGGEMCCLVETFPHRHESKEDFLRTLKFAYMYAKIVTLGNTHWVGTNRIQLRNRRIGTSVTGLTQFMAARGINALKEWLRDGYDTIQKWDRIYSDYLAIPRSIKTTSIKPSGCLVPSTQVKIESKDRNCNMSLNDIFTYQGYDLSELSSASDLWLKPTKAMYVRDENNDQQKITNLYINGKVDVLEFTLEDGTVVQCTPEHKFKLTDGTWKRADELGEGDDIATY